MGRKYIVPYGLYRAEGFVSANLARKSVQTLETYMAISLIFGVQSVSLRAAQMTGALGMSEDTPISIIVRKLRPFRIYDGASEVHRSAIGKRIFLKGVQP